MPATCPLDHRLKTTVAQALRVDPHRLVSDTVFRELSGWDSFAALALVYGIEDDFGVQIGYGALQGAATLGQLQQLIQDRLGRPGAASPRHNKT